MQIKAHKTGTIFRLYHNSAYVEELSKGVKNGFELGVLLSMKCRCSPQQLARVFVVLGRPCQLL